MANIDKALMSLSLEEEEDIPFVMPNLPKYCSCEKNVMSIMGRTLNPECQNMADLILDMPRKWQVYDRVRGVALSSERFQFSFKYEHDLEEVMKKRVWTFNEWSIVIDRWVKKPPEDYLQFMPVWIQIRNIPVNYYTEASIYDLGDIIGKVEEMAFDLEKPQSKDYVRVKVRFDVSKPVRRSKAVILPNGETTTVWYDFERIQKRCYNCQRLTHEKDKCPLLIKLRKDKAEARRKSILEAKPILKENDPLFGVLREDQVGLDPHSGRLKIHPDVLQEMRLYLLAAEGQERKIREERVKMLIQSMSSDTRTQNLVLRLEDGPVITNDMNKGKGPIFSSDEVVKTCEKENLKPPGDKLMASAIKAGIAMTRFPHIEETTSERGAANFDSANSVFKSASLGFDTGSSDASSSGVRPRRASVRRKITPTSRKNQKGSKTKTEGISKEVVEEPKGVSPHKRKAVEEEMVVTKIARCNDNEVVLKEGPPTPQ
ncbi:uncharacterized protein LOC112088131 [Eutrema salsugineum]|uniref:uncharacterized protein LOC112088131 n=1 Tax=Eutrema salsugineum TaxID=72664 RepID=UPI000CED00D1|nr:uncharacterized protein LOC112088131 [Eutrema salsugineum]